MANEKKIRITQMKSAIGRLEAQKRTIKALGLKRLRVSIIRDDTPAIRGMIAAVKHLVKVEDA